jgi:quercetin dioxygenase-like cupin family protein
MPDNRWHDDPSLLPALKQMMWETMSERARTVNWSEIPCEEVYPGITRQVVQGERQTLVRYIYQPESVFPQHHHPQEQVTAVLSGRIEFDVAGEVRTLTAGDVAVIPGDTPHGARVIGDEVVETLNNLSPRRDEAPGPGQSELPNSTSKS